MSHEARKKMGKLYAKAWLDDDFRSSIGDDPHGALASVGIDVPSDRRIVVHHDTDDTMHVVIPSRPDHLDDTDLQDDSLHADFTKFAC